MWEIYQNIIHLEILFLPLYIYSQSIYWTLTVLSQLPTAKEKVFIPIPKKGNNKECSNYCTITLISHTSKVMLKLLQARLQQYMNRELLYVQTGFRRGRRTRDQIANIHWIIEKATEFQNNIYLSITILCVWQTSKMLKLDLEKAEDTEIKLPTSVGSSKRWESSRKKSTCALLTTPKPLTAWITPNCGKFFRNLYAG